MPSQKYQTNHSDLSLHELRLHLLSVMRHNGLFPSCLSTIFCVQNGRSGFATTATRKWRSFILTVPWADSHACFTRETWTLLSLYRLWRRPALLLMPCSIWCNAPSASTLCDGLPAISAAQKHSQHFDSSRWRLGCVPGEKQTTLWKRFRLSWWMSCQIVLYGWASRSPATFTGMLIPDKLNLHGHAFKAEAHTAGVLCDQQTFCIPSVGGEVHGPCAGRVYIYGRAGSCIRQATSVMVSQPPYHGSVNVPHLNLIDLTSEEVIPWVGHIFSLDKGWAGLMCCALFSVFRTWVS